MSTSSQSNPARLVISAAIALQRVSQAPAVGRPSRSARFTWFVFTQLTGPSTRALRRRWPNLTFRGALWDISPTSWAREVASHPRGGGHGTGYYTARREGLT